VYPLWVPACWPRPLFLSRLLGGHNGLYGRRVSRLGLEPRTPALKGQCSTIELPARTIFDFGFWIDDIFRLCSIQIGSPKSKITRHTIR
jgi:hypothetical protein